MMGVSKKIEERPIFRPEGESRNMTIEPIPQPESDMDDRTAPGVREGRFSFSLLGHRGERSTPSLGRVLIISEDSMIRDFLGQMSRLLGYDSQARKEWSAKDKERICHGYDAIFLDSHFLHRFKNLKVIRDQQISD